jgi:adenylate kinase family enzyme
LDVYEEETRPVLDYFGERLRLETISGEGAPDDVEARLREAVSSAAA